MLVNIGTIKPVDVKIFQDEDRGGKWCIEIYFPITKSSIARHYDSESDLHNDYQNVMGILEEQRRENDAFYSASPKACPSPTLLV